VVVAFTGGVVTVALANGVLPGVPTAVTVGVPTGVPTAHVYLSCTMSVVAPANTLYV
jgi:hypothetical protein